MTTNVVRVMTPVHVIAHLGPVMVVSQGERSAFAYIPNHRGTITGELLAQWQHDLRGALDITIGPEKGILLMIPSTEMDRVDLEGLRELIHGVMQWDVHTYYVPPRMFNVYVAYYQRKIAA